MRRVAHLVLHALGVAFGVTVLTFLLVQLIPGDAVTVMLGNRATAEAAAELRAELGLDRPIHLQFWSFLHRLLTEGDTGTSLAFDVLTRELISSRIGTTWSLVGLAVLFAIAITVPLALWAATHRNRWIDHAIRILTTVGIALPSFWVGLMLIVVFAVNLGWFPVGGDRLGYPRSIVLPALTAAIGVTPILVRSLRTQLTETLQSNFVATLTAAGLSERRVLWRHVLPNSILPALVLVGTNIAYLLGGAVVVEKVFALPGLGDLMFNAIGNRDLPVIQGVVLYTAIAVVVINLLTDLLVSRLDPRLRS